MKCPRCDGQGLIYKARVPDMGMELYICDECEACWVHLEEISIKNFEDLLTFLEKNGLTYKDSRIEDLGYDWDK